jgi:hypothetical protein
MTTSEYLNEKDAAALLCCTPGHLRKMRSQHIGPRYFKPGGGRRGRILYKRTDILAYIESGEVIPSVRANVGRELRREHV